MTTKLIADKTNIWNDVKVNEYLLTKHNPNKIDMPTANLPFKPLGITVHNTEELANVEDDGEQYTRATINGNMKTVRVHFYVDDLCAWQNLPLTLSSWHAGDGNGNGNRKTISIECIMKSSTDTESLKAEDNCARLVAYLMHQYGWNVEDNLFTHTHWLNVQAGRKSTNDFLNTTRLSGKKYCPIYILPHWNSFKTKVKKYLDELNGSSQSSTTDKEYPYKVKVLDNALNIRDSASINAKINGVIKDNGVYTIIEECYNSSDGVTWGRLKSGIGWISLGSKYVQKI